MNDLMIRNEIIEHKNEENKKGYFLQVTTLDLEKQENKIKLYNALNECDILINDIKGSTIDVVDVYIEGRKVEERDSNDNIIYNEETGDIKLKDHYRSILFDNDGKTYVTSSYGVYNSLRNILGLFGKPSKDNVLHLKVTSRKNKRNDGSTLWLTVVNKNED